MPLAQERRDLLNEAVISPLLRAAAMI